MARDAQAAIDHLELTASLTNIANKTPLVGGRPLTPASHQLRGVLDS